MPKALTQAIQTQIDDRDVKITFVLKVDNITQTSYLLNWDVSYDVKFGSATGVFTLDNNDGRFGEAGNEKIQVGDTVELIEKFTGDSTEFKRFYGVVEQRSITKEAGRRVIILNCLDYVSKLQHLDIDLVCEGTRVEVEDELLSPVYLDPPNDMLAQLFNFQNDSIATQPIPLIRFRDKNHTNNVDTLFDGFECYSSDTEILTEDGWKLLKNIVENKEKIKIPTLNPEKNIVEYHYPEKYIKYKYNKKIFHQKGKRVDLMVTDNHKLWGKTGKNKCKFYEAKYCPRYIEYRKDFPYEGKEKEYFILPEYSNTFTVKECKNRRFFGGVFGKSKSYINKFLKSSQKIKMDDWLRFFGIWLAEGWLTKNYTKNYKQNKYNFIHISQNDGEKRKIIEKWISKINNKYEYKLSKKNPINGTFRFCDIQLAQYLKQFGKCYDKFIPQKIKQLSKRQLKILLDSMMLGDGSFKNGEGKGYKTSSIKLANDVFEIALKCGYCPTMTTSFDKRYKSYNYYISLAKRKFTLSNHIKDKREWINYNDYVYCVTVPNHIIYVRRNGKGCWCGNCYYDVGQLKLGAVLNVRDNYDVIATYNYYVKGVYAEDVIEDILIEEDGYCYSNDTEVLTEDGWKLFKDIVENKEKIKIATLNPEKNIVEYHYPVDYIKQKYTNRILYENGRRIDFKVTKNHNVWARQLSTWKKYNKKDNYNFRFYKAYELPLHIEYRKDFPYEGLEKKYFELSEYNSSFSKIDYRSKKESIYNINKPKLKIKMDDWLRFFGIWIAEGWVDKVEKDSNIYGKIHISQYLTWKQKIMNKWLKSFGFKYKYRNNEFIIYNVQLATYLSQFGKSHDKYIPKELLNLSKRQLNILLEALMLGDGKLSQTTKSYGTASKKLADNVQELALKCGYASNLLFNEEGYSVTLAKRNNSMPNQGKNNNRKWVDYNGYVYCLTVPNHLMYIRRNGKGCWSGNSNFLFGETSAQNVIDNHLTTTLNAEDGVTSEDLTVADPGTYIIETTLSADHGGGGTTLALTDASGFPPDGVGSGTASVNGDTFTYTGKSGNTLTGVSGLGKHNSGDYCEYSLSYPAGQVWLTSYNNITTTLAAGDFTLPSSSTFRYFDKRYGRLFLDSAISISETVTCDTNYSFKTLQASAIELNRITFRKREVANRFAAIQKVREYLPPNYIIRTQGDNKIWASYVEQKTTADYTLNLITSSNYLEDEDLYTRVTMWAKNKQPTNIMFGDDIDYSSDEEDSYTGTATKAELSYFGRFRSGELSDWAKGQLQEAKSLHTSETERIIKWVRRKYIRKLYGGQKDGAYYVFGTPISGKIGKIILDDITPTVYINGVPIDNKLHQMVAMPLKIKMTTKTIVEGGGKSKSVSSHTYYYYKVYFPHGSIHPKKPIYLYDAQGILRHTIGRRNANMNYRKGIWNIPGIKRNDVAEILSTASYWVMYSAKKLKIKYDDVIFLIHRSLIPAPETVTVTATFEYWAIAITLRDIDAVVDGNRDTQLQAEFFGEPVSGFHLATIDLGSTYTIQAIDIIGGFYKPDEFRKFDVGFYVTMQYSTDDVSYYAISDKTDNFRVTGGEAVSFEEEDLGIGFQARYLKFTLNEVDRIEYGRGRWVVAITEISVYTDIIIESEATLIPTTTLTQAVSDTDTEIYVLNTAGFTEPTSGTATAYIGKDSDKSFTYTGIQSGNTFTGCTVESGISGAIGDYVTQSIEGDTTLYDNDGLLPQLGDRVYKKILISDRNLYLQSELDDLAKAYLKEFYKNHNKIRVNVLYSPYLHVGQTVSLTDSYNGITNERYFIDAVSDRNGYFSITLAKYP